jgi:hypothetical protein
MEKYLKEKGEEVAQKIQPTEQSHPLRNAVFFSTKYSLTLLSRRAILTILYYNGF